MTDSDYTHTCQVCKTEFPATINKDGSIHKRKYLVCSRRCYAIATGRRRADTPQATSPSPKGTRVSKPCKGCGATIGPLPPGQLRQKTYCTHACHTESQREHRMQIALAYCRACWTPFSMTKDRKDFCSVECVRVLRKKITKELMGIRRIHKASQSREAARRKPVDDEIAALKRIAAAIKLRSRECAQCGSVHLRRAPGNRFCSAVCELDYKDTLSARRAEYARAYRKTGKGREARRIYKSARRAIERGAQADSIDPIEVFNRDKWICHLCGIKTKPKDRGTYKPEAPELDHIIALANGGTHTWGNVACACRKCNGEKGAKDIGQLGLDLAG